MSEPEFKSILLDYMIERRGIIESKSDLLRLYTKPHSARQAQILSDYFTGMLAAVKYDALPLEFAVAGLAEMAAIGFES